jgi:hypothetical protein
MRYNRILLWTCVVLAVINIPFALNGSVPNIFALIMYIIGAWANATIIGRHK